MNVTPFFDITKEGFSLRVNVQPGAGRDAIIGTHGDALKLRVVAPPVSGKANESVIAVLSRALDIPSGDLEITSGATARIKKVRVKNIEQDEFEVRLRVAITASSSGHGPSRR